MVLKTGLEIANTILSGDTVDHFQMIVGSGLTLTSIHSSKNRRKMTMGLKGITYFILLRLSCRGTGNLHARRTEPA